MRDDDDVLTGLEAALRAAQDLADPTFYPQGKYERLAAIRDLAAQIVAVCDEGGPLSEESLKTYAREYFERVRWVKGSI